MLEQGQGVFSGRFMLELQIGGNLVLYYNELSIWSSSTQNGAKFVMERSGSAVLYDNQGKVLLSTSTNNGDHFELKDTGFMVVYDSNGKSIWTSLKLHRIFIYLFFT